MANCVKCKRPVGCGCQLINGLCSTCRPVVTTPKLEKSLNNVNNTNSSR